MDGERGGPKQTATDGGTGHTGVDAAAAVIARFCAGQALNQLGLEQKCTAHDSEGQLGAALPARTAAAQPPTHWQPESPGAGPLFEL